MNRLRLRYAKVGRVRFTSHRDVARMFERALRRVAAPVAYSEGFSPRPKLHFGLALPTGYESDAEYLDVDLAPDAPRAELTVLAASLSAALPEGIEVVAAQWLESKGTSLQESVASCSWQIEVRGPGATLTAAEAAIAEALAADTLPAVVVRKGKPQSDDLRPSIHHLAVVGPTDAGVALDAELGTRPRSVRPSELLAVMGLDGSEGLVRRKAQWMWIDGARREPLPIAATSSPRAEVRAS